MLWLSLDNGIISAQKPCMALSLLKNGDLVVRASVVSRPGTLAIRLVSSSLGCPSLLYHHQQFPVSVPLVTRSHLMLHFLFLSLQFVRAAHFPLASLLLVRTEAGNPWEMRSVQARRDGFLHLQPMVGQEVKVLPSSEDIRPLGNYHGAIPIVLDAG